MTDKYADPSVDGLMDTGEDVGGAWGEDAELEIDEGKSRCCRHHDTHTLVQRELLYNERWETWTVRKEEEEEDGM